MKCSGYSFKKKLLATVVFISLPSIALAESSNAGLQAQIDALQNQVTALNSEIQQAAEWKNPNTLIHLAGYADVGFVSPEKGNDSFVVGTFSPIFHFQYRDVVMLESELEFEVGEDGETEVNLDYLTIDWFVSDYATIIAGKFLSPIGQFRQNLHPSWINKLPSAPPGFGHDGAAPISDLGLQVRGGFPIGGIRTNYAVYASNGPELNSETEDEAEFELEGVRAEGIGADRDGDKTFGGRFAILPISSLEIGLSFATGKATVTELENEVEPPTAGLESGFIDGEIAREYDVIGADFVWFTGNLSIRGEYVKTEIGEAVTGVTTSEGAIWESLYTQLAYRLPDTKWEGVIRYADFDSPLNRQDVTQTMLGINYLVSNNFIAKLAYEINNGVTGSPADDNRLLLQLAYGF
ncbi:hypothetical protein MNBD_GAMMA07-722 [hydrothermal vent metagenome]|uniref:Phosphate-selective porin O and P n=1 Tax=hydrothermal vent metagenome TaxID=652676 RepID=A0A3B0X7W2_9ZZZZ